MYWARFADCWARVSRPRLLAMTVGLPAGEETCGRAFRRRQETRAELRISDFGFGNRGGVAKLPAFRNAPPTICEVRALRNSRISQHQGEVRSRADMGAGYDFFHPAVPLAILMSLR